MVREKLNPTSTTVLQESRVKYNQQNYRSVFTTPELVQKIDDSVNEPSLIELVQVDQAHLGPREPTRHESK